MARVGHPTGQGTKYYRNTIIKNDLCVWCNRETTITTDHIHPVSYGGPNHWSNYAPTCQDCNQRKGNQSVLEFFINRQLPKGERITLEKRDYIAFDQEINAMWFDPFGLKRREGEDIALRV